MHIKNLRGPVRSDFKKLDSFILETDDYQDFNLVKPGAALFILKIYI